MITIINGGTQGLGEALARRLSSQGSSGLFLVGRSVEGLLFGVSASDPRIATLVTIAVLGLTALAFFVPARVAAGVDPASATRDF